MLLSLHAVVQQMFRYPETLGLIMAGQLLIGRYTGYRVMELYRFRDFLSTVPAKADPRTKGLRIVTQAEPVANASEK